MNIKHENVPGQLQELTIEIQKEDYAENVDKALKSLDSAKVTPPWASYKKCTAKTSS